jgi:hypothetical protein
MAKSPRWLNSKNNQTLTTKRAAYAQATDIIALQSARDQ